MYLFGAVHGFAGNVAPLLRGAHLLDEDARALVAGRVAATLEALAYQGDGLANWPSYVAPLPDELAPHRDLEKLLLHVCHGAPGVALCLAATPVGQQPTIDRFLLAAGELVWRAGPLRKGGGLCHGTSGNGYLLLRLFERTGELVWRERARAFAMHALHQTEAARERDGRGRWSLWTGDLGVACFLWDCLRGAGGFPTLDVFF